MMNAQRANPTQDGGRSTAGRSGRRQGRRGFLKRLVALAVGVFAALRCRVAELDQRVADLEGRLKLNSTNVSDHGARSGNRSAGGLLG